MKLQSVLLALGYAAISLPALAETPPAPAPAATPPAASGAPAQAQPYRRVDPDTPIARVNGVILNAISLSMLRDERAGRGQGQQSSDEYFRDSLINAEIMAQEATKLGLDKDIGIQTALELNRKELLGRALVEDYISKHPVADDRIKTEYDRLKAKAGSTEYRARHILVSDEKLAKDLIAKLGGKKPAKFEDLAKTHSKDGSAKSGGDLGWMAPSNLVPEFASAMTKLKKGEISKTPVKSQFGWHIIKLEESRAIAFPEYEKAKDRIANQLAQNDIRKYVGELRAVAKVEVPTASAPSETAAASSSAAPDAAASAPASMPAASPATK
jgi:peptidyl-prolyl cis-trans isomerase C